MWYGTRRSAMRNAGKNVNTNTTVTTNNITAVLRFAIKDPSDFDLDLNDLFFVFFGSEHCT